MSKELESSLILLVALVILLISVTFNPVSALIILVGLLYKFDDIRLLYMKEEVIESV